MLQHDQHNHIIVNAGLLQQLPELVESGKLSRTDIQHLAKQYCGGTLGQKLSEYIYLSNSQALQMDEKEVLGSLIYKTQQESDAPVFVEGCEMTCLEATQAGLCHPIYRRAWIPGLLVCHWRDERVDHNNGSQQIKRLAQRNLNWNGKQYILVADSPRKSFYFPKDELPEWIQPWIESRLPQHKADLQTLLKRPGYKVDALNNLAIKPEDLRSKTIRLWDGMELDVCAEQGAWVLEEKIYKRLAAELGVDSLTGFQGTVLMQNGSYFKGALLPAALGLHPGIYGGIKWAPGCEKHATKVLMASVMNSFAHYPWQASMNRQQTDYADAWDELPVHVRQFDTELVQLALTGFPPYVKRFNNYLLASAARLFRKIDISGFAGQVALGRSNTPEIQFQVYLNPDRHPQFRDRDGEILNAAWLANPSLPINLDIPQVRIEIVVSERVYDQLLVLNMSDDNLEFVGNIYMATGQDDGDGDGSSLDIEPEDVAKSAPWQQVRFHNTLRYKAQHDVDSIDNETAIDVAFSRSIKTQDIGRGDKLIRRLMREYPGQISHELKVAATRFIQMTISSAKKFVGDVDQVWTELWQLIPQDIQQDFKVKMDNGSTRHDQIDALAAKVSALIKAYNEQSFAEGPAEAVKTAKTDLELAFNACRETMPGHYSVALQILALQQEPNIEIYARMRRKGEELLMLGLRKGISDEQMDQLEERFQWMHQLWRQVSKEDSDEHRGLGYSEAAEIIKQVLIDLFAQYGPEIVYGSMLVGPVRFSDGLLARVLSVEDLQYLDRLVPTFRLLNGLFIPIQHPDANLSVGSQVTKDQLSCYVPFKGLLKGLDNETIHKVVSIQPFQAVKWFSYFHMQSSQSNALIHIIPVN